jgi:hypothetical protein
VASAPKFTFGACWNPIALPWRSQYRTGLPQKLIRLMQFKELTPRSLIGLLRHQKGLASHIIIVTAVLKILLEPLPNLKATSIAHCDIP